MTSAEASHSAPPPPSSASDGELCTISLEGDSEFAVSAPPAVVEEGCQTVPEKKPTFRLRLWNRLARLGNGLLWGAEFIGEVFADFLGVTDSKYQFVIDSYERHMEREAHEAKKEEAARRRRQREEDKALQSTEEGHAAAEAGGITTPPGSVEMTSVGPSAASPSAAAAAVAVAAGASPHVLTLPTTVAGTDPAESV